MQHDIYKLHKRLLQGRTRSEMLSAGKHSHSESMLHMLRFQWCTLTTRLAQCNQLKRLDRFVRRSRPSLAVGQLGLVCWRRDLFGKKDTKDTTQTHQFLVVSKCLKLTNSHNMSQQTSGWCGSSAPKIGIKTYENLRLNLPKQCQNHTLYGPYGPQSHALWCYMVKRRAWIFTLASMCFHARWCHNAFGWSVAVVMGGVNVRANLPTRLRLVRLCLNLKVLPWFACDWGCLQSVGHGDFGKKNMDFRHPRTLYFLLFYCPVLNL